MPSGPQDPRQDAVRKWYGERYASGAEPTYRPKYAIGRTGAEGLGYDAGIMDAAPPSLVEAFCGVGNPLSLGEVPEGAAVLDVGCGAGFDCFVARSRVGPSGRVDGVDLTPEMVSRARHELGERASLHTASAEALPFADESFDVVISNAAINLMPDKPAVLREIQRVLRPGGSFWLADVVRVEGPREEHGDPDAWSQ